MAYKSIALKKDISIDKIVTIHYFEYRSDFSFSGELHDFWEFLCVDKGTIAVKTDSNSFHLRKDDIIFHQPNEFHALEADGQTAPNLVVISFECNSPYMEYFKNKILRISEIEKRLLANIITEAKQVFSCRLDDPYLQEYTMNSNIPFGAQQLIILSLEELLIRLIRRYTSSTLSLRSPMKPEGNGELYQHLITYLENNLHSHVTIEQICRDNLISRSQLQKLFRQRHGYGVIHFYSQMKMNAAKELIRENHLNFSQISDALGYTSIHYFSRQFKKLTGMTPSEYASSIKSLSESSK